MSSTTSRQDDQIQKAVIDHLDTDFTWLFTLISEIAEPEDVFSDEQLEYWAKENGFVKET